jgi:hypothetical protein
MLTLYLLHKTQGRLYNYFGTTGLFSIANLALNIKLQLRLVSFFLPKKTPRFSFTTPALTALVEVFDLWVVVGDGKPALRIAFSFTVAIVLKLSGAPEEHFSISNCWQYDNFA